VLTALVREEYVVHNVVDEVVGVVADHLAVEGTAGDVAAGRCRWWGR
jgi:hypothetical protein